MGTRNLTMVIDKEGTKKAAQYGQWDGYPSGQGKTIVSFLQEKENRDKLLNKLKVVRFIDEEGRDKEFIDSYNKNAPEWSNEPDNRTDEQIRWWNTYQTRDIGGEILETIANSTDSEITLMDRTETALSDGWVEYTYIVDFSKNKLICKYHIDDEKPLKEYDLDKLPKPADFVTELESIEEAMYE